MSRVVGLGLALASALAGPSAGDPHQSKASRADRVTVSSRVENQCAVAALAATLDAVQSASFKRAKWKFELERRGGFGAKETLSISAIPIDLNPGGGGHFLFDCDSGKLTLVEGYR